MQGLYEIRDDAESKAYLNECGVKAPPNFKALTYASFRHLAHERGGSPGVPQMIVTVAIGTTICSRIELMRS